MSQTYVLKAEARDRAGKGVARQLRRDDRIPAVVYGDGKEPVSISLVANDVKKEHLKGHMFTSICELQVEGAKHMVLARDIQLDPVRDFVLHVDFLRITPKTKINVRVPVHFENEEECKALSAGGILNIVRHEVELLCQATKIPDHISIDLTAFEMGDAIKISDVKLPEGATPTIDDRDFTIATIASPRVAAEDDAADKAEAAAGEAASAEDAAAKEAEKAEDKD